MNLRVVDESINHVEGVLKQDIDSTWEYAIKNEQYSRKNNLRVFGIEEGEEENLEGKFIFKFVEEHLEETVSAEEVEIIYRVGARKKNGGRENSWHDKPRPVIVKLQSHKTKMKILLKQRMLKGKGLVIVEDMADQIAKRLKELKSRGSVEMA
ncbi:uncharacterized protein LOC111342249 [Stylophora pistillata]|uniref:uncharacterized protein LOC111342249 n=1 Tax=Stylophora pistillata TaxID=50429 RepID=UPI000C041784|nr:uncharacterized protein LOC111342249 [Stylophora pistillata]